jgi:tRNA-specific 2-thiouridylase
MSGGVDSSVAAWLLREAGHDVIGLFMRHGHMDEKTACSVEKPTAQTRKRGCCSVSDAADARRVAEQLDIPFYAINFEEEFGRIIHYFVDEYTAGRTPNPCVVCNTWLKFGKLMDYADSVGAEGIATGHYARLLPMPEGPPALCRGDDPSKDQSYVLWGIRPDVLSRLMFPVGDHKKDDIRLMAEKIGLRSVAEKPDSQEICFVPDQDHAKFVRANRAAQDTSGEIVTTAGAVVGRHDGFERFTIGQRKGLGVALGEPHYVVHIDPSNKRVILGEKIDLARNELTASGANWLISPENTFSCQVKIRYRSQAVAAQVSLLGEDRFSVRFDEPCYAVAPGQAVVCYQENRVLGGGWIN